jgi:hypothetical protein
LIWGKRPLPASHRPINIRLKKEIKNKIRLSYQFNSGKKRGKIDRTKEEIDNLPKKGF